MAGDSPPRTDRLLAQDPGRSDADGWLRFRRLSRRPRWWATEGYLCLGIRHVRRTRSRRCGDHPRDVVASLDGAMIAGQVRCRNTATIEGADDGTAQGRGSSTPARPSPSPSWNRARITTSYCAGLENSRCQSRSPMAVPLPSSRNPGRVRQKGCVRYVHIAVPTKYASCMRVHGVLNACVANDGNHAADLPNPQCSKLDRHVVNRPQTGNPDFMESVRAGRGS
jgi:hypothetical protein